MEIDEIDELQKWLDEHKYAIPKKQVRKETILDIAGIEHLENHWSDIYRYFFDIDASHGLSRLFIDSLQNLLKEKNNQYIPLTMEHFKVSREVAVQDEKGNNKRIDLLLYNDDEAIIVENKVYASLYNSLELYWGKTEVENKRGVVLSLNKISVNNDKFVNITHEELAKEIEKQLPSYFLKAQPKALILLQDFIQNIYNITKPMNPEELEFYFNENNRQSIRRLAKIDETVRKYISETITDKERLLSLFKKNEMSNLKEVRVKTDKKDSVYYVFQNKDIMLKLKYASIWNYDEKNGCGIQLYLVIKNDLYHFAIGHKEELEEGLKQPKDNTYGYYKGKIDIDSPEDLKNESSFDAKIIQGISHFYELGKKIIKLYNEKHQSDIKNQQ